MELVKAIQVWLIFSTKASSNTQITVLSNEIKSLTKLFRTDGQTDIQTRTEAKLEISLRNRGDVIILQDNKGVTS